MFRFFAYDSFVNMYNMFNPFALSNPFAMAFGSGLMPMNNYYQRSNNYYPNSIFSKNQHSTYNSAKGELLAQNMLDGLPTNRDPNNPLCARYVKNGIVKSGLGRYELGNGEDTQYMLRRNLNFKEIKVKGSELENLKKGCTVVYDAFDTDGVNTIGKDGHVMVSLGDGKFASDKIEDASEIVKSDNAHVFMVV